MQDDVRIRSVWLQDDRTSEHYTSNKPSNLNANLQFATKSVQLSTARVAQQTGKSTHNGLANVEIRVWVQLIDLVLRPQLVACEHLRQGSYYNIALF